MNANMSLFYQLVVHSPKLFRDVDKFMAAIQTKMSKI